MTYAWEEPHPFRAQRWPRGRRHEYGNIFCADCGTARQAGRHRPEAIVDAVRPSGEPLPPPPNPAELEARASRAADLVAQAERRETEARPRREPTCLRLHPNPDRPFATSAALNLRYQECDGCGMVTGWPLPR